MAENKELLAPHYASLPIRGTDILEVQCNESLGDRVRAHGRANWEGIWRDSDTTTPYRSQGPALPSDTYKR